MAQTERTLTVLQATAPPILVSCDWHDETRQVDVRVSDGQGVWESEGASSENDASRTRVPGNWCRGCPHETNISPAPPPGVRRPDQYAVSEARHRQRRRCRRRRRSTPPHTQQGRTLGPYASPHTFCAPLRSTLQAEWYALARAALAPRPGAATQLESAQFGAAAAGSNRVLKCKVADGGEKRVVRAPALCEVAGPLSPWEWAMQQLAAAQGVRLRRAAGETRRSRLPAP